jgi:hypothetical protein
MEVTLRESIIMSLEECLSGYHNHDWFDQFTTDELQAMLDKLF